MSPIERKRSLLVVAGICLLIFACDRFVLTPLTAVWRDRAARIERLGQSLSNGRMLLDRAQALRQRWDTANGAALPLDPANAERTLLQAVNDFGAQAGLNMTALKPSWVEDDALGTRLDVRVSAEGGLKAIGRFLYDIETGSLPIRVEDVELRARDSRGSQLAIEARMSALVRVRGGTI